MQTSNYSTVANAQYDITVMLKLVNCCLQQVMLTAYPIKHTFTKLLCFLPKQRLSVSNNTVQTRNGTSGFISFRIGNLIGVFFDMNSFSNITATHTTPERSGTASAKALGHLVSSLCPWGTRGVATSGNTVQGGA